jgi:hypothetical protein
MIRRQTLCATIAHLGSFRAQSLGDLSVRRRRAGKPKPLTVSVPCLKGKHYKCFKKDCVCECHREGEL